MPFSLVSLHMSINDVAGKGCIMYEVFFVHFWVIILYPVFVHENLKMF